MSTSIHFFTFLIITVFIGFSNYAQGKFPENQVEKGYVFSEFHGRVAYPVNNVNRIWVKGNSNYPVAIIKNSSTGVREQKLLLTPPFYTAAIDTELDELSLFFCNQSNDCKKYGMLFPKSGFDTIDQNFSIMIYGCFEPFEVVKKTKDTLKSIIHEGTENSSFLMRELFRDVAINKEKNVSKFKRGKYKYIKDGFSSETLLRSEPKLIIGTGDQVYVDAGYGRKLKGKQVNPISAWEVKRRPLPTVKDSSQYLNFMNSLYNASYSFVELEEAHRNLPSVFAIDDHDLRDGWGSQGDEYINNKLAPKLKTYYNIGKRAFVDHQLIVSNYSLSEVDEFVDMNKTMNYSFKIHGKNGYVFDLRSARNIKENTVLGIEQWKHFEEWLKGLSPNQEIILITSIPLTLRPSKLSEKLYGLFSAEGRDDIADGWSSRRNKAERNKLFEILTKHRLEREIKPIFVSGDVHKSALVEIWVDTNEEEVAGNHSPPIILGYEIIASALSHEFIASDATKKIFEFTESQKIGDAYLDFTYKNKKATIYPMVRKSAAEQNFGAIEFYNGEIRLHTFLFNRFENYNTLNQYYINLNWKEEEYINKTYRFHPRRKDTLDYKNRGSFNAPLPNGMNIILKTTN